MHAWCICDGCKHLSSISRPAYGHVSEHANVYVSSPQRPTRRSELPIPPPPPTGPPPAAAKAVSAQQFLRTNLASTVEDVHAHMLDTGMLPTPKHQACPTLQPSWMPKAKPPSSRPKPPPSYVPRVLVNDMIHTQSLITLTKQLINQLQQAQGGQQQAEEDGYPAIRGTASSSSSTVPSHFAHDGHGYNIEVIKCMCCCDHPVVRARMCNFVVIIQLFVHTWFVFL